MSDPSSNPGNAVWDLSETLSRSGTELNMITAQLAEVAEDEHELARELVDGPANEHVEGLVAEWFHSYPETARETVVDYDVLLEIVRASAERTETQDRDA